MHNNEIPSNIQLIKKLIIEQFPQWKNLPIKHISSSGTDNTIYKLGTDMCIRVPRITQTEKQIKKEQCWLPKLAPFLPLPIPKLIGQGLPTDIFPYSWSIYNWIDGKNCFVEKITNQEQEAKKLAEFIRALQRIDTTNAPFSERGVSLSTRDTKVKETFNSLKDSFDIPLIESLWNKAINAPEWNKKPVWLHGDLLPVNLLINQGSLTAVIDFGFLGIGDPAIDLLPAWSIFSGEARNIFRTTLQVDAATWNRGKGWALSIALIIIPYYKKSNTVLVEIAEQIIQEIITDY